MVAFAGIDQTVWLWDAASRQQLGQPVNARRSLVGMGFGGLVTLGSALALGRVGDHDVIASTGADQLWDAASGEQLGQPPT